MSVDYAGSGSYPPSRIWCDRHTIAGPLCSARLTFGASIRVTAGSPVVSDAVGTIPSTHVKMPARVGSLTHWTFPGWFETFCGDLGGHGRLSGEFEQVGLDVGDLVVEAFDVVVWSGEPGPDRGR
jgi:hypothetical protein